MKGFLKFNRYVAIIIVFVLCSLPQRICGAPAYPHPVDYTLPDGSVITIQLRGDEFVNWQESVDGYTMLFNSEGFLEYAVEDENGDLKLSGVRARGERNRSERDREILRGAGHRPHLRYSPRQIQTLYEANAAMLAVEEDFVQMAPVQGTIRMPIILVEFEDRRFVRTREEFVMLFNQLNYTQAINNGGALTGSLRDYFRDVSYGRLDLVSDLFGPVRLPNPIRHYAGDNGLGSNVPGSGGHMASEALQLAIRDHAMDYRNYLVPGTTNEAIAAHIVFAGHGREAGGAGGIWSHASSPNPNVWTNGPGSFRTTTQSGWIRVNRYSCSPELRGGSGNNLIHIGVIAHEIGHSLLRLPDFYNTGGTGSDGIVDFQDWDLMAGGVWLDGGRTPAIISAWPRVHLGWTTEIVLPENADVTLLNPRTQEGNVVYRINTPTNNEYFLFENRQRSGWDARVYASGLLIYHVDRENLAAAGWNNNIVCARERRGYSIRQAGCAVAAGCRNSTSYPRSRDVFPQGTQNSFTDQTTPNSRSRLGHNTNRPVTNITHNTSAGTISFRVGNGSNVQRFTATFNANGGSPTPTAQTVDANSLITQPTAPTRSGFTFAGWWTQQTGGTQWNFASDRITQNITLWARWTATTTQHTVTFNANGGAPTPAAQTVNHGSTITQPTAPTRQFYAFDGWWTQQTGGTLWNFTTGTVTANITLWARWTPVFYTATLQHNDGTGATSTATQTTPGGTIALPVLTRNGYTHNGWTVSSAGTGTAYTGNVVITSNLTMWASWTPITYTITYHLDGGTNDSRNPATYTIETANITLQRPTKTGHTFGGWFGNAELTGTAITSIARGSTGNRTLWARWIPLTANIHLNEANPLPEGIGWTFASDRYTILDGANVYIYGANANRRRLQVAANATATITLNGITIDELGSGQVPLMFNSGANVTLILEGTNTLIAGNDRPAIEVTGSTLTINGTGSLTATGGNNGAGIGGRMNAAGGTVIINDGIVRAIGGTNAQGIGRGSGSAAAGTFTMNGNAIVYASSIGDTDLSRRRGGLLFIDNNGRLHGESVVLNRNMTITAEQTLTIPHNATLTVMQGSTLTNNGAIRSCGRIVGTVAGIAAQFHNWVIGELVNEPTCESSAEHTAMCNWCEREREDLMSVGDPLGHLWGDPATIPATCEQEGRITKQCNRDDCGGLDIIDILPKLEGPECATSIIDVDKSGKHGIKFAMNPVSEKAEMNVVLPNGKKAAETKIAIYDMTGNVVFSATTATGGAIVWDLRNNSGRIVANGTYLVIAEVKDRSGKTYQYSARLGVKR